MIKGGIVINTEIKNTISATEQKAQYDASAKRLLGEKIILAHILVKTVEEFKGMNPKDVVDYIEGEPYISAVPVENGLTNTEKYVVLGKSSKNSLKEAKNNSHRQKIVGLNTENHEINEGLIRFDIVFYVRMRDGFTQMIINVEAQKDEPTDYKILNRGIFYVSRLISSQKERDFENSNYDDIKQVYSIWICLNMSENTITHYRLKKENIVGEYDWKGNTDLINIVMIGLSKDLPEHDEKYELHRLLTTLLSSELTANEKLDIMEKEYEIPTENKFEEEVNIMCNLSQGVEERGEKRGEKRGRLAGFAEGIAKTIFNMYDKNYSLEQIAEITDKTVEEVEEIIKGRNC